MRLFGKLGGTAAQLRAALLTMPFDLALSSPSVASPDICFDLPGRSLCLDLPPRSLCLDLPQRSLCLDLESR